MRVLAAALLLALGCIQDDGSRFNPIEVVNPTIDDDAERELGMEFDREVEKKIDIVQDEVVAGFISELGQSIVETLDPQPFIYRFRVIKDPHLNAFAVPGGYIYFHSGTVMNASSIDELAGVMGHEIAHVKGHHYARMRKATQIPDLLVSLAGLAAAAATGEPGLLAASQAVNVAVQLRYSREYETEADELGGIFMSRAGYQVEGMERFFERILAEKERTPFDIPPYLYSHPDVEDRIAAVEIAGENLHPMKPKPRGIDEALYAAQARLARLLESDRTALPSDAPPPDRSITDPLLADAGRRSDAGDADGALFLLARAASAEPNDPRVHFRIAEILASEGRTEEAIESYRRTLRLDPSRAQVYFQLGLAYRETGKRHLAVYAFEQAGRRAGDVGSLRERVDWEIEKLTFTVVPERGFADGRREDGADTPVGASRDAFDAGATRLAWWARLHPRFIRFSDVLVVRWTDPSGAVAQEDDAEALRKPYLGSVLEPGGPGAAAGEWTVELMLRGDVLDKSSVQVRE